MRQHRSERGAMHIEEAGSRRTCLQAQAQLGRARLAAAAGAGPVACRAGATQPRFSGGAGAGLAPPCPAAQHTLPTSAGPCHAVHQRSPRLRSRRRAHRCSTGSGSCRRAGSASAGGTTRTGRRRSTGSRLRGGVGWGGGGGGRKGRRHSEANGSTCTLRAWHCPADGAAVRLR